MKNVPSNKPTDIPTSQNHIQILGIGLFSVVIAPLFGYLNAFLRKIFEPVSYNPGQGFSPGMVGFLLSMGLAITAILKFIKCYKSGEKSWKLWAGIIPAIAVGCFWILMISGELIFPH